MHLELRTRLALICHPYLLNAPLERRLGIIPDKVALVAHHPPVNRRGEPQFELGRIQTEVRQQFGRDLIVLPISQTVRRSFEKIGQGGLLWNENWPNLLDVEKWKIADLSASGEGLVIGRHSRPDLLKWPEPELARSVYPEIDGVEYRMLGTSKGITAAFDPWPEHWQALPFAAGAAGPFLQGLQLYSYYHSGSWVEAFGYNILEAMASGLPVILPPHFEENFGDAALYARPEDAADLYRHLAKNPKERVTQGKRARAFAASHHGLDGYSPRFEALVGASEKVSAPSIPRAPRPDRVLAVTSNGVGVGHLSRQLSIASAQPLGVETIFFSLSQAACFAEDAGFPTEYRAFHRQTGADPVRWNAWFRSELCEAIVFYEPDAIIFDGNTPYQGLLDAFETFPSLARVWVRRGMWRGPHESATKRGRAFDLILEPQDLAEIQSRGHEQRDGVRFIKTRPIISVPLEKCLGRSSARRLLGLPEEGEIVLLQLGSGSNFDTGAARDTALKKLLEVPGRVVVELLSPARKETRESFGDRHIQISRFPMFLHHRAFDFAVSACGYNSFHEMLAGRVPCLFVPNDAPEMDLQEARAQYAANCGWSLAARADDPYGFSAALDRLSRDRRLREDMVARMNFPEDAFEGAAEASDRIGLAMRTVPAVRG